MIYHQLVNEVLDDNDEETFQCSNYFERGFSCVSEEACGRSQPNPGIILKGEDIDAIFRDEVLKMAQCPDSGMVCCYNEDIL